MGSGKGKGMGRPGFPKGGKKPLSEEDKGLVNSIVKDNNVEVKIPIDVYVENVKVLDA